MNDWADQTTKHSSTMFGTLLLPAGSHVGALPQHLADMSLAQTCVTKGRDFVSVCTQCLACGGCAPHLEQWETKYSTCKDALFN